LNLLNFLFLKVATPIDMVRLAVSMDGSAIKKDILNSTSIGLITSAAINSYGLGVKLGMKSFIIIDILL
jgi:hypothetical protein